MTLHEEEFLSALRSVVIHLIKHDQSFYKPLTAIVESVDENHWPEKSAAEKAHAVAVVREQLPALDTYYAEYPHGWSRARYSDLRTVLPLYEDELRTAT